MCRSAASASAASPAEPADRGVDHSVPHHDDPFAGEQLRLSRLRTGNQPTACVHHSPPWKLPIGLRQQTSNEACPTGETGVGCDVTVRDDLTRAERHDHLDNQSPLITR
jgi:hypothetical protein